MESIESEEFLFEQQAGCEACSRAATEDDLRCPLCRREDSTAIPLRGFDAITKELKGYPTTLTLYRCLLNVLVRLTKRGKLMCSYVWEVFIHCLRISNQTNG